MTPEALTLDTGASGPELSRGVLVALRDAGIPFLIGGGYAFIRYTGIERPMKDFDVFLHERDWSRAARALGAAGIRTTLTFPHWLGKAQVGDSFVDIIFGSGNGVAPVDDGWFQHAVDDEVLGIPVGLVPREELLWTKSFVMERERFDGADVAHLIRVCGGELDWPRLLARYGEHWQVLLGHLVFVAFIYPGERALVPSEIMTELLRRQSALVADGSRWKSTHAEKICRGTLVSRAQYLVDVETWGYTDPREAPRGGMSEEEITQWTAAIDEHK